MKKPPRPLPKIPTPESLANGALFYLGRFAASEASLRRVLHNRLRRVGLRRPDFAQDTNLHNKLRAAIEDIIERYKKSGLLNDAVFAASKTSSLRRAGKSRRAIQNALQKKGVGTVTIATALDESDAESGPEQAELAAALKLARRRKLGPYRTAASAAKQDPNRARKDVASMARGGFSLAVIRKVLGGEVPDDVE